MSGALSVAVVGAGTIGKRVSEAVVAQPDMRLAGVAVRSLTTGAVALARRGELLFTEDPPTSPGGGAPRIAGRLDDLLAACDVVVDCTPRGTGMTRADRYEEAGVPAVFCGGESHEQVGFTFHAHANFDLALGRPRVRVASCNTTGTVRVLAGVGKLARVDEADVVFVRCATDPDKAGKGAIASAVVEPGPSRHGSDIERLLPRIRVRTQALTVPMVHGHVLSARVRLARSVTAADVATALAATPRVLVEPGTMPVSTADLRAARAEAGRRRGDGPEVLVWHASIDASDGDVRLLALVHMEAIAIPDVIDAARAVTRRATTARETLTTTDHALGIDRAQWDYDGWGGGRSTG